MSTPAAPDRYVPSPEEEPIAEHDRVTAWRQEQLTAAGYDTMTATWLAAQHEIDLHLAVQLGLDAGPVNAFRILY